MTGVQPLLIFLLVSQSASTLRPAGALQRARGGVAPPVAAPRQSAANSSLVAADVRSSNVQDQGDQSLLTSAATKKSEEDEKSEIFGVFGVFGVLGANTPAPFRVSSPQCERCAPMTNDE